MRSLEIIGEAAAKMPREFREHHPQVEWSAMRAMRNRLTHGYFGIDYEIVWDVVQTRVGPLRDEIVAILDD